MSDLDGRLPLWDALGFSTKDERHRLMADVIAITLAWQIRAMRADRGWTQEELAKRAGTSQEAISRLEDPKSMLSVRVQTLINIAQAFDCALVARFQDWKSWMENMLTAAAFAPLPFDKDRLVELSR